MPPVQLPGDRRFMPRIQGAAFGASPRFAVSPGDEEHGYFHMAGGQSGHPLSPYYGAGQTDWEQGRPTPFLPGPVEATLTLRPASEPEDRFIKSLEDVGVAPDLARHLAVLFGLSPQGATAEVSSGVETITGRAPRTLRAVRRGPRLGMGVAARGDDFVRSGAHGAIQRGYSIPDFRFDARLLTNAALWAPCSPASGSSSPT